MLFGGKIALYKATLFKHCLFLIYGNISCRVVLFGSIQMDAFDLLPTFFFFSYQLFKLKLSTYLTDLPTNYSITLQDILYATD